MTRPARAGIDTDMPKTLVLVDGEHYPQTTRWGLATARSAGHEPVACLLVGGTEKLAPGELPDLGVTVERVEGPLDEALRDALERHDPDVVLDLSDEPVLDYRNRLLAASVALAAGVPYAGADFALEPPRAGPPLSTATIGVIGTGKRTGKTAIAGSAARAAVAAGFRPVIVAMGRGGPPEPRVVTAGSIGLQDLLALVRAGEHGASDYLEDAVTTGVTTVGARRCGGGLAGATYTSNVREAATLAERLGDLVFLEGSGAAVPGVPWDVGILCCPADAPPEYLGGYLGPYRVLISDVIIFTMGGGPTAGPQNLTDLTSHARRLRPDARIVITDFRTVPLGEVRGKKVYFATTAPPAAVPGLVASLEDRYGCTVVGATGRLADRVGLGSDLDAAPAFDTLLTELKAAAIDVAAERALERGAEVVFADNRAVATGGDDELDEVLTDAARLAAERARER